MQSGRPTAFVFSLVAALLSPALAEKWLIIDPNDPYTEAGDFHHFDIDSAFEDRTTGLVAANMTYVPPAVAANDGVTSRWLWAFDCNANTVYYVATAKADAGLSVTADWRSQPASLVEPVMGGVTNMFGAKLCALKGSWPVGDLP